MDASSYAGLPKLIHATATGDGSALAEAVADGVPTADLLSGGLKFGVVCGEFAPFTTQEAMGAAGKRAMPGLPADVLAVLPQLGRPMQASFLNDPHGSPDLGCVTGMQIPEFTS